MSTVQSVKRVDVFYLWPSTIQHQARPSKLVYLDLLHWVSLSKAHAGHADGHRHRDTLVALVKAVEDGTAVFPLSDSVYFEVGKMAHRRQRRELREVMELLSRFAVVASRAMLAEHELEAFLDEHVGPNPTPIDPTPYLDRGVARALGRDLRFSVRNRLTHQDVTTATRTAWPGGPQAFDALMAGAELMFNRVVLDGPAGDQQEAELRARGYDRLGHIPALEAQLAYEEEQIARFDSHPDLRRDRLRDCVVLREIGCTLSAALVRGLDERGTDIDYLLQVFGTPDGMRAAFDALPSFDVAVTLKTQYHRNPEHVWTTNDITDIDALGSTLPYCDIVATDKAVASHVNGTGLADRLGTFVTRQLHELVDHL